MCCVERCKVNDALAGEAAISLSDAILVAIGGSSAQTAMTRVATAPRCAAIRKLHRSRVAACGRDDKCVWQIAIHAQRVGGAVDGNLRDLTNRRILSVIEIDVEGVVGTNTILVTLILDDMEGAPARAEAGGMDNSIGGYAEGAVSTDNRNTACPRESLNACSAERAIIPCTEITAIAVFSFIR